MDVGSQVIPVCLNNGLFDSLVSNARRIVNRLYALNILEEIIKNIRFIKICISLIYLVKI